MTTQDLTLLQAAISKMHWNEARQKTLSENIANADTPGYEAKDIAPLDFKSLLKTSDAKGSPASGGVRLAATNAKHLSVGTPGMPEPKKEKSPYEASPTGNSVSLEEQLMKMNKNFSDHHLSTVIYQKNIDMLRNAIKTQ
jgi:flagellar basal-body rod protein FlgB